MPRYVFAAPEIPGPFGQGDDGHLVCRQSQPEPMFLQVEPTPLMEVATLLDTM